MPKLLKIHSFRNVFRKPFFLNFSELCRVQICVLTQREHRRHWNSGSFLLPHFLSTAVLNSVGRITPKDAAHRLRRNVVEKISQN